MSGRGSGSGSGSKSGSGSGSKSGSGSGSGSGSMRAKIGAAFDDPRRTGPPRGDGSSWDTGDTRRTVSISAAARELKIQTNEEVTRVEGEAGDAARAESSRVFNELKPDIGTWTGGTIWESAEYLAAFLSKLDVDWPTTRVVELGTGCGLVGLTAAAHGAQEAVLTDLVLHVATINADANFEG